MYMSHVSGWAHFNSLSAAGWFHLQRCIVFYQITTRLWCSCAVRNTGPFSALWRRAFSWPERYFTDLELFCLQKEEDSLSILQLITHTQHQHIWRSQISQILFLTEFLNEILNWFLLKATLINVTGLNNHVFSIYCLSSQSSIRVMRTNSW